MITANKLAEQIKKFDAYPKTLEDFRIKTFSGAAGSYRIIIIIIKKFFNKNIFSDI